ncbi:MAG TPA: FAD-dependent oxidoreductase [Bryobacteraceae bacterium]|nr:FAD-dependent oxidoreductase [Bryobacteraceae bacterium]
MPAGVVIIGGGQAGVEAASALRVLGYDAPILLIGEEPHLPYQRPPLSKDYLLGKLDAARLPLRAEAFYDKQRIGVLMGQRAAAIEPGMQRIRLQSGASIPYDHLILAVGARNRPLPVKGAERVLYLRTRDEADTVRERLRAVQSVAAIGGGFIGLELAAAARTLGKHVTVVEAAPRLMTRAVPPLLSDFFRGVHRREGVEIVLGAAVEEIEGNAVKLGDGTRRAADAVFAGIGVIPNTELAHDAGLAIGDGIAVDEFLRTSDPRIFAIGDCAEHPNPFAAAGAGQRVRLESVQNAVDQAKCVARNIMGPSAPYRDAPWFWTDQFDIRFQMAGLSGGHDRAVVRGSVENRKFSAFYFKGERCIAADSVNRFGDHIAVRKLLAGGSQFTPQQAADEAFDLKRVVQEH